MSRRGHMPRAVAIALAFGLSGCSIEIAPTVPTAPERRALVVPMTMSTSRHGVVSSKMCATVCPKPADGEALDDCHGTELDATVHAHREALGEHGDEWVVCYYGAP